MFVFSFNQLKKASISCQTFYKAEENKSAKTCSTYS